VNFAVTLSAGQAAHSPPCRHARQHIHVDTTPDDEVLDHVEAVQFGSFPRQIGQVPAGWRGRSTNAPPTIQRSAPRQDAGDRRHRRNVLDTLLHQFAMDGTRPELAKVAAGSQSLPEQQHAPLHRGPGPSHRHATAGGPRGEVRLVQGHPARSRHPPLNRAQGHPKLPRHRSLTDPRSHYLHHRAASIVGGLFFSPPQQNLWVPSGSGRLPSV
jgi:hypothetical protein